MVVIADARVLLAGLVKQFEGLRLKAYLCPAGVPTIGYGHTAGVTIGQIITKPQALILLEQDLSKVLSQTLSLLPSLANAPSATLAAIADFTFNLGAGRLQASTLRRRILHNEWDQVPYELRRWVRGGGRILPGLVARREAEIAVIRAG